MSATRITVLMTCHNRKDTTLACLDKLMNQKGLETVKLEVYIVDAGSTDGTAKAISERFPEVQVIRRDTNHYWCDGTRVAFSEAVKRNYDYYLWLNDDTMLFSGAVRALHDTAQQTTQRYGRAGIIVGSTRDPETGVCTYGGVVRPSKWRPLRYRLVEPSNGVQSCDTMNGNCVLISSEVVSSVGNISEEFTHGMGDRDYGLRAKAHGFPLCVAPNYVGECARNPPPLWTNPKISLKERLKILRSPKGLPPREWAIYAKRHAGAQWPLYWLQLYMRVVFPRLWTWLGR